MGGGKVTVNRAPVLTLWAAVVAERLGFDHEAALTLGKAVAGLNAQSKGRALGIFRPAEATGRAGGEKPHGEFHVELMGRTVRSVHADQGIRALDKDKAIAPAKVEAYLQSKFGETLPAVRQVMHELAATYGPEELEEEAFGLYERFRPVVAPGTRGWGQAGELDIEAIRALAKR